MAFGNKFMKAVKFLNAAKNEVFSTSIGSTISDQIYVLENLSLANHVDLVSIDTQGRQRKYERFGIIFMLLVWFTDFWDMILA